MRKRIDTRTVLFTIVLTWSAMPGCVARGQPASSFAEPDFVSTRASAIFVNELFKDADVLHHFHHTREAIHSEAKRLETLLPRKDNLACAYALFLLVAEETMQQGIVVERAPVVNLSRELAPISSALSAMPNDDKEFLYYAMLLTAANLKILNRYPVTRVEARSLAAPGFEALSTYRRSRQEARRQAAQAYSTQTPSRGSTPSDAQIQRDLNASHNMMPDHYDMLNTLQSMKKW